MHKNKLESFQNQYYNCIINTHIFIARVHVLKLLSLFFLEIKCLVKYLLFMQLNNNIIMRTGSLKCNTKQIEYENYTLNLLEIFSDR